MPGSIVTSSSAPPVNGPPTDTGTAYIAAIFEKGPLVPTLISSVAQGIATYGADISSSSAASYLEAFFRIGGRRAWVNRLAGPAALAANLTLNASGATASVKFTAASVGSWGNALRLAVIAGTGSNVKVQLSTTAGIIATSGDLATKADVLAYTGFSSYGAFSSAGAGTLPVVVAAANLTGGTDDSGSVTDSIRTTTLTAFTVAKGPGQVLLPGDTRAAAATILGAHAAAFNRRALYDLPDDGSAGTVAAAALALTSDTNAAKIIAVGPWVTIGPAVPGGTDRDLPYSIVQAAVLARQDALTGNPNQAAAGDNGIAPAYVQAIKHAFTDAEYETLNTAGANMARDLYGNGQIRMYGSRTLTNPTTNPLYLQAQNVRLDMLIVALGKKIADRYVFQQIDGQGRLAAKYGLDLEHMLANLPEGALYAMVDVNGDPVDPGYVVDTSTGATNSGAVNTPETAAALQLRAVIGVRRSPGAEFTYLEVVNVPVTEEF